MKLLTTLFVLITLQIPMQSQDFPIMLLKDNFVKAELLTPKEMQALKPILKKVENVEISGVSRTFQNEESAIVLEFYSEVGLKVNSKKDLSKLRETYFSQAANSKILYANQITKSEFDLLVVDAEKIEMPAGTESDGNFSDCKGIAVK